MALTPESYANVVAAQLANKGKVEFKRKSQLNKDLLNFLMSGGETIDKSRAIPIAEQVEFVPYSIPGINTRLIDRAGIFSVDKEDSGLVDPSDFGSTFANLIYPDTPGSASTGREFLGVERVGSGTLTKRLFIPVPRALMRLGGLTPKEFAEILHPIVDAAAERARMEMSRLSLFSPRVINPSIESDPAARIVRPYPVSNNYRAPVTQNVSNVRVMDLKIANLKQLIAIHANSLGKSSTDLDTNQQVENVEEIRRLIIFSNSGWAQFQEQNAGQLDDTDINEPPLFVGEGVRVQRFLNSALVTMPDSLFPRPALQTATNPVFPVPMGGKLSVEHIRFGPNDAKTPPTVLPERQRIVPGMNYYTGNQTSSGYIFTQNLYSAIIVAPREMSLKRAAQVDFKPELVKDPAKANEFGFYSEISTDYAKLHDGAVHRIFFLGIGDSLF